jgi:putative ATPase
MYAFEKIGAPEGLIPLSNAIVYVCEAPKSNAACSAMFAVKADAELVRDDNIPPYLKDNSFGDEATKKNSLNYKYPHDYGGYVKQQYLPDSLKNKKYYIPKDIGFERQVQKIRISKGMIDDNND